MLKAACARAGAREPSDKAYFENHKIRENQKNFRE
jgi:hypothetical protein